MFIDQRKDKYLIVQPNGFSWAILGERELETLKEGLVGNFSKENESLYSRFRTDGLIDNNCSCISEKNKDKKLSIVVLHTTDNCNLNCDYCYTDANKSNNNMEFPISRKVIDRIIEQGKSNRVKIEFHGGEPLLNWNLIEETVNYVKSVDNSNLFRYSIQTNGILIDNEKADFFAENNFSVGISLDGPKEFHDKYRMNFSGDGSFEKVLSSIDLLNRKNIPFGTACVVTDPEVINYYPEFMEKNNIFSVKFNPYFSGQGRAKLNISSDEVIEKYTNNMISLMDRVVSLNSQGDKNYSIGNFSVLLGNIFSKNRNYMCLRSPCGAGISMLGVGTSGDVYSCEEMNGRDELIIGNINNNSIDEIISHPLNTRITNRSIEDIADCGDCFVHDVCKVNCANRSFNQSKDFYSKTPLCDYYKKIIPEIIWKTYDNPEIIKCLM